MIFPFRAEGIARSVGVFSSWGGWQAVTGVRTTMRVYARTVIDDFVNTYFMAYRRMHEVERANKLAEYLKVRLQSSEVDPRWHKCHNVQSGLRVWWSQS